MGYKITVGNAVPKFSKDDGELYAHWDVENQSHDAAPTFQNDDMTGNTNSSSPSYTGWFEFCKEAGILQVFYDDELKTMKCGHPGCMLLTQSDYDHISAALKRRKVTSKLPPGFSGFGTFNQETKTRETPDEGKCDSTLARLIWLEYWIGWALKNCETPAVQNI